LDVVIAFLIGLLGGAVLTTLTIRRSPSGGVVLRPSKRQQKILATLPPDPVLPSIQDLVLEEAQEIGLLELPGGAGVPVHVRLKVWKRDHDPAGCTSGSWTYRVRDGVSPADAGVDDVTLTCLPEGASR
jgi:hypothetical protein